VATCLARRKSWSCRSQSLRYNSVKDYELKGIKSNDLFDESALTQEVWQNVHSLRETRFDILKLLLPDDLYSVYQSEQELIKSHIFQLLADEINDIIQQNFFFLIENNFGNKPVIDDLFDQVSTQLVKTGKIDRLNELTVG
jgi:hypothetical protein